MVNVIAAGPVSVVFADVSGVSVGAAETACRAALGAAVEARTGAAMALSATTAAPVRMIKHRRSNIGILPGRPSSRVLDAEQVRGAYKIALTALPELFIRIRTPSPAQSALPALASTERLASGSAACNPAHDPSAGDGDRPGLGHRLTLRGHVAVVKRQFAAASGLK